MSGHSFMTEHNKSEIRMMNQILLALVIMTNFGFYLFLGHAQFPWFAYLGAAVGLSIILLCWTGKKFMLFITALLVSTTIFLIVYNWSAIFSVH
ncbi:hypothetical protein CVD25_15540 [Bacillus canaveralius]|uniref:Uncharacterized protein n=1 Tax=Bacillus canaveralius TaxID=1403243 RepID=A0A2N5GQS1_9BACI|nr:MULTISPECIES: hypothetical protein [Bacillus]PLR85152.1 hypothetical protein CVD23_09345 [Bacillus sp. V33-4]PLR85398.1 hypothetical protein CU635_04160 [Bacillus canaveralius]PLR94967.1 hypothetical protein CVD25_15540 [Bacillus canaveralius]RSK48151.1 hypothetical protein EJA13_17275 [Bacillus canaveralius]